MLSSSSLDRDYYYQIKSEFEFEWNALGDEDAWPAPTFQYDQDSLVNVDSYCEATFKSFFPTPCNPCNEAYLQSCQIRFVYFWPCEIKL